MIEIISLAVAPLTGVATWFAGRHMQRLEYNDKSQEVIAKLQLQNADLLHHIEELEDKIVSLTKQLTEAKTSLCQLQATFDMYIYTHKSEQDAQP